MYVLYTQDIANHAVCNVCKCTLLRKLLLSSTEFPVYLVWRKEVFAAQEIYALQLLPLSHETCCNGWDNTSA